MWIEESSGSGLWPIDKQAPPETLEGKSLRRITDEFNKIKSGNWKTAPLTIGLAVAIVGGAIWLVSWASKGQTTIKNIAGEAVERHVDRDIDRAHPDLPKRYVQKQELKDAIYKVDKKLLNIETSQQIIIQKLDEVDERRYTRTRRTRTRRTGNGR